MITWYEKIYIHNSIVDIEDIKQRIEKKDYPFDVFCIIDSVNDKNVCEIVSLVELSNPFYINKDIKILGIAKGKTNIKEVLKRLVLDMINEEGIIDKKILYMQGGD